LLNNNFNYINRLIAFGIFLLTFIVYFDTMAPTVSYWDCGEFIAVSHTLGVPHPPGSPFFLLLGRIFSMLPFNEDIAFRVNIISPLVSALAVMLLYLSIVKVVTHWRGKVNSLSDCLIVFGGGAAGALAFAFTDSHWFNAVEAEVYAFSTFFTAIVVWLILLWNEKADEEGHERYLLIIAYMIGLATGLHLLNLLAIPFITLIIYFRKYKVEWKSFGINVLITAIIFFVIHNGIIKGLPKMAAGFLGVWGTAFIIISVFGLMIWAVLNKQHIISIATTSIVLVLIGYSTYTMIFIRSNQDPVIDEYRMSVNTDDPRLEEKQVLFSEGELWTVDSELEDTLPEIQEDDDFEPEEDLPEAEIAPQNEVEETEMEVQRPITLLGPKWESEKTLDSGYLSSMNDAERLIVSIASSREISPSDAEIQARLEVGRPRLSQIYNSLHKSGILAVRKQGRSRLFKISEAAGELLRAE